MATFEIVEGPPGQGKSLYTARVAKRLVARNRKWFEQGNPLRLIYSNLKFSEQFEKESTLVLKDANTGETSEVPMIRYWTDSNTLVKLEDADLIWDEIATELDARNWPDLGVEMKRFLSQYRKRGIDIYANTQDFSMIDQRARLMISGVCTLTKLMGSRDISTTKPNPNRVWGIVWIREVENYRETAPEKKQYSFFGWSIMFITRELIAMYDTRQDIPLGELPRLKHVERYCEHYGQIDPKTGKLHKCQYHADKHV